MSDNGSQAPKVFISYSWDSEEHQNNVLDLAYCLREHGIDCSLDRFEISFAEGNQASLHQQIENSDYVIVVCTEEYKKSFQGKEQFKEGNEILWKGFTLNRVTYDRLSSNKFIPVIFASEDSKHIPTELRQYTYYLLDQENLSLENREYQSLYRHLSDRVEQREPLETPQLPDLTSYDHHSVLDSVTSQKELTKSYRTIRNLSRTKSWNEVISVFQQMQDKNLPYFDPDGYYRLACNELIKQEQQTRKLNSIYNQGTSYYETKNWLKAQEKLEQVLQSPTTNRALAIKAKEKLNKIRRQLDKEKKTSILIIILGWLISILLPINIRVLGGFTSGIVAWYVSHQKRLQQPSQEVLKLFLFIFVGTITEVSLFAILGSIFSFNNADFIINFLAAIAGIAISIKVMNWQIDS